ncbi:DUF6171 family protein [uncultured Enterococcus sp.]|uniref:DUF6171 family protein n=1 Tax=uncultured Enterococcus sp. TaxID=167972 RepID=UPI002AA77FB8|nr:DUF6171 family protein [uncultured Enterococcus sp.]
MIELGCIHCEGQREAARLDVEELILEQLAFEPKVVSEDIRQKRILLCEQCPNRSAHTCTSCGCYYAFRAALPSKKCPLGRW